MPRKTKKEQHLQRADDAAPFLFDENNLPIRADVVQAVKEKRYEHTGARLLENEQLAVKVVEGLMLGHGVKRIAKALNISPKSIRAARKALESQGKLAPWKERVVGKWEDAIEAGSEKYLEGIENGLVAPAQIPVGMAILFDKRQIALGEPTQIVGKAADQEEFSVEKLNAFFNKLPQAKVIDVTTPPNDSQSSGNEPKPLNTK